MNMATPENGNTWTYSGKTITWIRPEHCLLLVGYDDNCYIFNDPQKNKALTYYSKNQVEVAYRGLHSQAVVILPGSDPDVLSYPDTLITNTETIEQIKFSQNNYNTYEQAYNDGKITYQQKEQFQSQVENYMDALRADYIIVNPQSDYAYAALGSQKSNGGNPFNRLLTIGSTGLDVVVLQKLLELIDYYTLPLGETYGYYDEEVAVAVSCWKDPNWTPTTPTLRPGGSTTTTTNPNGPMLADPMMTEDSGYMNSSDFEKLLSETTERRSYSFLDRMQEYSRQHLAVQTTLMPMLDATGIEVGLPGTGPNGGIGRADILKKENNRSMIWEVKHNSQYSTGQGGSGNAQLERYLSLNASVRDGYVTVKHYGEPGFDSQRFSVPLERGETNFKPFYIPYDANNYLFISFDSSVPGLITYDKIGHGEKLSGYDVLTNQDTLRNLNSSGVVIALIGTAVVIVGAAIFVACPPAGVAGVTGTAIGGSGTLTLLPLAQQVAEDVIAAIAA